MPATLALARDARFVLKACGIPSPRMWAGLALYYALTPFNALLDGLSWLLLLRLFASTDAVGAIPFVDALRAWTRLPGGGAGLLATVAFLFLLKACAAVTISILDSALIAAARRRVQEACYKRVLNARWSELRGQSVGRWMGVLTEETSLFVRLFLAALQSAFALIQCGVLLGLAFAVEKRLSLLFGAVGVPVWLALRLIYRSQGRLSAQQAGERQGFVADVNERLAGLFQIKAAGETAPQERLGVRHQPAMQALELKVGWSIGVLNAFNPLLFFVLLTAYLVRSAWTGAAPEASLLALGSVGILAFRASGQLNSLIGGLGNMSRLSGSIEPLKKVFQLAPEPERLPLPEPLAGVRLDSVAYSFGGRKVLDGLTAEISGKKIFLVTGPSGAGKTTLANLISGLERPSSGRVLYRGASGKDYSSAEYRARIAYVPQDIHLYSGTVRENLDPWGELDDGALRESLAAAGAAGFVAAHGGLDGLLAEAGRSLSGGEKRRLGIAKALAQKADCLILDEITNGLDESTKAALLKTISALSKRVLIVAVSHDLAAFESAEHERFPLAPA